eukprot:Selendium_serpulae@DN3305_c0_g1_i1.p1
MAKTVLVPIADGSEEIETAAIIDILSRAGTEVTLASVSADLSCKMSRGFTYTAGKRIAEVANEKFDMIAIPGGMPGAKNIADNETVTKLLKQQKADGRFIAAICASPAVVLDHHGLLDTKACCYPAPCFELKGSKEKPVVDVGKTAAVRVCVDGKIITSRGPATAIEFALTLVEQLVSKEKRQAIEKDVLFEMPK